MASKGFFENYPTIMYDGEGKGEYKQVVDIMRRVSLRNSLKNYIQLPLLENIDGTMKPERLAHLVHGEASRNWLVMMMNNVENPYTDWFMGEEEFYNYMITKYPNKAVKLNQVNLFLPGESVSGRTVVSSDPTLKTLVYTGNDFAENDEVVTGVTVVKTYSLEIKSIHHLDSDGQEVTNWDYEYALNEQRSQVSLLSNEYLDVIEEEFNKKIK